MKTRLFYALTVLLLAALACSFPGTGSAPGAPADAGQPLTAAAETVQAVLAQTQAAPNGAPPTNPEAPTTESPAAAPSDTPQPPATDTPTNTPTPTITLTPRPCNQATFITDVTIPDGTELPPNDIFIKTWRLKNVGTCSWTTDYALVFSSGDQMNGPAVQQLTQVVNPGETVDISVELTAPATAGTYRGYWRLRDASGNTFGLTNGNDFWVEIKVVEGSTFTPPIITIVPPVLDILVTLDGVSGESGTLYDPPDGVPGTVIAGDTSANAQARGYINYDISALSGATVVSAELTVNCSKQGDPFGDLSGIWLGEVQFTPPLDQSDFDVTSSAITKITALPVGTIDVTGRLQARIDAGANRFQIRFHPAKATDSDNAADYLACTNTTLKVVYH